MRDPRDLRTLGLLLSLSVGSLALSGTASLVTDRPYTSPLAFALMCLIWYLRARLDSIESAVRDRTRDAGDVPG